MTRPKFIRACLKKWRRILLSSRDCGRRFWPTSPAFGEDTYKIPRDVPKGHMAVYIGEDEKRYVTRVAVLNDPIFRALLDEARREVYDFRTEPRLLVHCDENTFVDVMRRCASREKRGIGEHCFCGGDFLVPMSRL